MARAGLATVFPQAIGLAATFDTNLMHNVASPISTEARGKYNDAIAHDNHGRYFGHHDRNDNSADQRSVAIYRWFQ